MEQKCKKCAPYAIFSLLSKIYPYKKKVKMRKLWLAWTFYFYTGFSALMSLEQQF